MKRVILLVVLAVAVNARAGVEITEWMYQGLGTGGLGEFVEFTNVGSTAIDLTGWSYSDSHRRVGTNVIVDLSSFGTVAADESVIITERTVADFRTVWGLSSWVKVLSIGTTGGANLARADEINLYDSTTALVDRLTYGDPGSNPVGTGPRTQGKSCNIPASDYSLTVAPATWVLSSVGDQYGSWQSTAGEIGSPGQVPEPATIATLALGGVALLRKRQK
ncbi:MAG: lamin tail domain-containing protein [Sedimentisphaerales bacterium]